jgi:molybdenum cofactor cytidylyltransferase
MKFQRVTVSAALGHVLGHNVSHAGRRVLRKGLVIGPREVAELSELGVSSIYTARLEPNDVAEDVASRRIGLCLAERGGLDPEIAHGGRVSLRARDTALVSLLPERLLELNLIDGVTLATLPNHSVVEPRRIVATLKVIPFALPEGSVQAAERLATAGVLDCRAIPARRVRVLIAGAEDRRQRLLATFEPPLRARLLALGVGDVAVEYVSLGGEPEQALSIALGRQLEAGAELVVMAGETATMDGDDLAPQAIRRAGGRVEVLGAPVFPGNLLLLGYRGNTAILGAPGCVRSRERNIVDLILPRLLLGDALGVREIAELGCGGMLAGSVGKEGSGHSGEHD